MLYFYSGMAVQSFPFRLKEQYHMLNCVPLRQILALCITATNTFSSLLAAQPFSIPAFQTLWNYILLTLVYGSYTIYRYGFKGWIKLILKDGWKYIILAFLDVEGNYFTVLAYRYT